MAQCSKAVWYGSGFRSRPCSRMATVERNGKSYCKQHDPERVAAKRKERSEAWDRKWAEREQRQKEATQQQAALERKAALVEELVAALRQISSHDGERWDYEAPDPFAERKPSQDEIAQAAIAKAEKAGVI